MDTWIVVPDHLEVAPEDKIVGYIEANHGCEESNVGFGNVVAKQIW